MTDDRWLVAPPLEGAHVRLEPLASEHEEGLLAAALHPELWTWMPWRIGSREELRAMMDRAFDWVDRGWGQAWVIRAPTNGAVVGSSSYLNADAHNRRVEIGATWVTPAYQRTPVNTETKLLLMAHAFDALGARRVEFKTDSMNARSRAALLRIGAKEEGTLRNHMIRTDGSMRHSVYFGVIDTEWPHVRVRLEGMLARRA